MTDPNYRPSADETTPDGAPPAGRKPRYPRPWWVAVPRMLLALNSGMVIFYIYLLVRAALQHTLQTTDRDLLSAPIIIAFALLAAGGAWAIRDMIREEIAENRQRKAERSVPFAVRAERRARNDLEKAREQGDRRAEGKALSSIGSRLNAQERYAEAEAYLTQSLALARDLGDRFGEERDLVALACSASGRGNLDEAEALHRESLAVTLQLTRETMPFPDADDADVLQEVADSYALFGQFLVEERDKRLEGRQMLAQAEARYREEARFHELAAQAHRFGTWRRRFERSMRRNALERAQEMRDLLRQYGGDGG